MIWRVFFLSLWKSMLFLFTYFSGIWRVWFPVKFSILFDSDHGCMSCEIAVWSVWMYTDGKTDWSYSSEQQLNIREMNMTTDVLNLCLLFFSFSSGAVCLWMWLSTPFTCLVGTIGEDPGWRYKYNLKIKETSNLILNSIYRDYNL